ncbi:MAG: RNA-binding S4 domain-containing protein [Bacteroidetes bacterium]|nr:RNA-binding S4 domain-containing protein [Bacteroidota bacterium]
METFKIKGDFIQLNQLIKAMGWCENGAQANNFIDEGLVRVNGEIEYRKRNKLIVGTQIEFNDQRVIIE